MSKSFGITGLILQSTTYESQLGTAGSTTLVYTGPKDLIDQNAFNLYLANWKATTNNTQTGGKDNPIWQLTAIYQANLSQAANEPAGTQEPSPVWETDANTVQQSIFELDVPVVTSLSSDTKERIAKALKNPTSTVPLVSVANIGQITNALKIYHLAQIGIEGKPLNARTVKRTITVPRGFANNWNTKNEGKVFSKDALIQTYNVDPVIWNDLPDHSPRKTPIDSNLVPPDDIYAFYGYLEGATRTGTVGTNMVQKNTAWQYGRYPMDLFTIIQ